MWGWPSLLHHASRWQETPVGNNNADCLTWILLLTACGTNHLRESCEQKNTGTSCFSVAILQQS